MSDLSPVESWCSVDLVPRGFVYRCWSDDECLYIGQHVGIHPAVRLRYHRFQSSWWSSVTHFDYREVEPGEQDQLERDEISRLKPRHNIVHAGVRRPSLCPSFPDIDIKPGLQGPAERAERELRAIVAAAEPASWLPSLAELSERLSLSKTVLARAMRKLADEQLVVTRHGYGTCKI